MLTKRTELLCGPIELLRGLTELPSGLTDLLSRLTDRSARSQFSLPRQLSFLDRSTI